MHKFMRAIGFSKFMDRKETKKLIKKIVTNCDERNYCLNADEVMLGEFRKYFADGIGIAVCGEFDENDKFIYNYFYPYLDGLGISSYEDISVERHAMQESYAGVCDDLKVGISLIFYLRNMIPYISAQMSGRIPMQGTSLSLAGLSISGSVLMPLNKSELQKQKSTRESSNRRALMAAARKGDGEAIETLSLEDMDIYSSISRRMYKEDIYSMVDTFFMPYGIECDQYFVLGEILDYKKATNMITGEEVYILTICANELTFDVCINIIDLFGEPKAGRRFKGVVWMQGTINFPDEE